MLPDLVQKHEKYKGYTIKQLCQEMHNFYKGNNISLLQKKNVFKRKFPWIYNQSSIS